MNQRSIDIFPRVNNETKDTPSTSTQSHLKSELRWLEDVNDSPCRPSQHHHCSMIGALLWKWIESEAVKKPQYCTIVGGSFRGGHHKSSSYYFTSKHRKTIIVVEFLLYMMNQVVLFRSLFRYGWWRRRFCLSANGANLNWSISLSWSYTLAGWKIYRNVWRIDVCILLSLMAGNVTWLSLLKQLHMASVCDYEAPSRSYEELADMFYHQDGGILSYIGKCWVRLPVTWALWTRAEFLISCTIYFLLICCMFYFLEWLALWQE